MVSARIVNFVESYSCFRGGAAGAAVLWSEDRCAKLALPDQLFASPLIEQWDEKQVTVHGRVFEQPDTETGIGIVMWFAEQEGKLSMGICDDGPGLYLNVLYGRRGEIWSTAD